MRDTKGLRSSALLPGEPGYESEFSPLNIALLNIPKDLKIRELLRFRPLGPKHSLALRDMHARLFPIRYDTRFFDIACGVMPKTTTDSSFIRRIFDTKDYYTQFPAWQDSQILSIGCFFPRKYLEFYRSTGCYDIEKYLCYLNESSCDLDDHNATHPSSPSDSDADILTLDVTYDKEYDEYIVGFATILVNMDVKSGLVSDEDYVWLDEFYRENLFPIIGDHTPNDKVGPGNSVSYGRDDHKLRQELRNCWKLNTEAMDDCFYQLIYNNIYNNTELLEYTKRFDMKNAKTLYILSAGITMGLRRRFLGTTLILFIQVMVYFCCFGVFLFEDNLYRSVVPSLHADGKMEFIGKRILKSLQLHFNKFALKDNDHLLWFYNYVLGGDRFDTEECSIDRDEISKYKIEVEDNIQRMKLKLISSGDDIKMPLVLYLHVICYNNEAFNMYKRAHFSQVTEVENYYSINGNKFTANILAHYIHQP